MGGNSQVSLGVIGLGQWFEHLSGSFSRAGIRIARASGRKPFSERAGRLAELGMTEKDYYVGMDDGKIPEQFFKGIGCVYVASPNSMHGVQTVQTLGNGNKAVVEKTLATDERTFKEAIGFIRGNGKEKSTYMHLHYIHKQLTMAMGGVLGSMEAEHGKALSVAATFLERYSDADRGRKWLFSMREGGIFMDWIHPYEVLFHGAGASEIRLRGFTQFNMNPNYGTADPSGIEAFADIGGSHFARGAKAAIRIGKGAAHGAKRVRFNFEDSFLEFNFPSSRDEERGIMGSWGLFDSESGSELASGSPTGMSTADMFSRDIVGLCNGSNNSISIDELERLYAPQWDYQRRSAGMEVLSDPSSIARFVDDGLGCRV